ncbi:unnamed protein product [Owenia fusiformis]|uniref:COMM domain-containing protein 3 n=1 Tax=Owenia fusiformis TaxID=6347 RepID=A0A8S4PB22_OWEFU|nr:unnamed protein product [Owenia fusiformis]
MEFSAEALEGLHLSGDSAHIPDQSYINLCKRVCEGVLHKNGVKRLEGDKQLSSLDQGVVKQTYAALATLVLEAAKHDADSNTISAVLEDCKYNTERIKAFNNTYLPQKPYLQLILGNTGTNPPHIVDVDWRLDYYIKNNHLEKVNEAVYLISLKTEECGFEGTKSIDFACTVEQLQDMVGKLKDACKSLERSSQM